MPSKTSLSEKQLQYLNKINGFSNDEISITNSSPVPE